MFFVNAEAPSFRAQRHRRADPRRAAHLRPRGHGLGNREVAQTLFVTEKTIELHLTSAYRKLGIRSRYQLPSVLPLPAASA